jgi:type IV secretion system protein TrbL
MCMPWEWGCVIGEASAAATDSALDQLVEQVKVAVGDSIMAMTTMWVNVVTPTLQADPGVAPTVNDSAVDADGSAGFATILGYVMWISLAICIMSVFAAGAMLALNQRRGEGTAHLGKLGITLTGVILISASSAVVTGIIPAMGTSGASDPVGFIQDSLWWYVAGMAIFSVVVAGARMAWTQRLQPGKDLLQSLLTLVIVSSAGLTAIGLAVSAADGFALWILDGANTDAFRTNMTNMLGYTAVSGSLIGVLVVGLVTIIFSFVQVVLMVIRGGMLVLLAGIFPVSASFTNTETGRAWFKKCVGWLIAFILYKPAAAIVYAAAFKLTSADIYVDDGTGFVRILTGLALMAMALVALPALMKFIAPMVAATGGGGGAGMALVGATAAAVGSVATGAVSKSSNSSNSTTSSSTNSTASGSKQTSTTPPPPSSSGSPSSGGPPAPAPGPVMVAQAAAKAAKAAATATKNATEDAAGGGPTGK